MDRVLDQKSPQEQVAAKLTGYLDRILRLCGDVLGCAEVDDALLPEVFKLRGDTRYHNREYEKAAEDYQVILDRHPDFAGTKDVILGKARCLLELHRSTAGIAFVREVLNSARYKNSDYRPFFYNILWQLHLASGDIDGMIQHSEEVQRLFPLWRSRRAIGPKERDAYTRYLSFSAFRKPYALWAKGDVDSAWVAFEQGLEIVEELLDQIESEGNRMVSVDIYRKRIQDNIHTLEDYYGEPPRKDLDEVVWTTPHNVLIRENKGKAVVIMFRGYKDTRSKEILQALDSHVTKHRDRMALTVVSYRQGKSEISDQLQESLLESLVLGLESTAVGRDPDPHGSLIRSFGVGVGSASLVIFDRNGYLAWWMQDPRTIDTALVIRILDRISSE